MTWVFLWPIIAIIYYLELEAQHQSACQPQVSSRHFVKCLGSIATAFLWLLKTFILSFVLNIMVDKGNLLSCVVVVVVVVRK